MNKINASPFLLAIGLTGAFLILLSISTQLVFANDRSIPGDALMRGVIFFIVIYFAVRTQNLSRRQFMPNDVIKDRRAIVLSLILMVSLFFFNWIVTELEVLSKTDPVIYISKSNKLFHLGNRAKFFLTTLLITPIGEEILFRGCILSILMKHYGAKQANVCAAAVFSIGHIRFDDSIVSSIIGSFLLGLLLGWIVLKTANIKFAILIHFGWNLLVYVFSVLMILSAVTINSVAKFAVLISVLTFISLLGFALSWNLYKSMIRGISHTQ